MHYNIQLGFLAADAIREFSQASNTGELERYEAFLERSMEYCRAVRKTYAHLTESDVLDTMPESLVAFMRTIIRTRQPSPTVAAKLAEIESLEEILNSIEGERRRPSDEECLTIARAIYTTSAADPR